MSIFCAYQSNTLDLVKKLNTLDSLHMVWICAGNGRREIQAVCRCLQITLQCAFLSLGFSAGSDLHGS